MLSHPLLAQGISAKYITSGSKPIVDDLLAGDCKLSFATTVIYLLLIIVYSQREYAGHEEYRSGQ